MGLTKFVACLVAAGASWSLALPASADVSRDYARDTWDHSKCHAPWSDEVALATGDITGDGRSDAVMLWTCESGAGGAHPQIVSYWIDGQPIRQKSLVTPLPQAYKLSIRNGQVIVKGGTYSGVGVPLCCPDVKVTLTYRWNGRKLVLVDRQDR